MKHAIVIALTISLYACAAIERPTSPAQVVSVQQVALSAAYGGVADALNSGLISRVEAQSMLVRLDEARSYLRRAQDLTAAGTPQDAAQWLYLGNRVLLAISTEIAQRRAEP